MENYNKLMNIAMSVVVKDSKVLLIKRTTPPYVGYWTVPEGKVEFGEHPEEAAVRELKEETNIDAEAEGIKGIASEVVHNKGDKVAHFLLYVCKLKPLHMNIAKDLIMTSIMKEDRHTNDVIRDVELSNLLEEMMPLVENRL